jgi:phosphatidate cytidylyltransferase
MKPANFLTRTITALFFAVLMICAVLAGALYFAILMLLVFNLGMIEFYRIVDRSAGKTARLIGHITGSLIFALIFACNYGLLANEWLWVLPLMVLTIFVTPLLRDPGQQIQTAGASLSGIALLAVPFALFASLSIPAKVTANLNGSGFILIFLAIIWLYDTSAYLIGSWIGKHKLYERISPGKTWEGAIGGMLAAMALSRVIYIFFPGVGLNHLIAITFIIIITGTLGDLFESMIKRQAGVKDSGNLLPGHGGILDRFDAIMFSAPAVFLYISVFKI